MSLPLVQQGLTIKPTFVFPSTFLGSSSFHQYPHGHGYIKARNLKGYSDNNNFNSKECVGRRSGIVCSGWLFPVDPWNPSAAESENIASQLFAFSLFPYLGFLYFITKSKTAPKLTLFGFYFLLAFVGATSSYGCININPILCVLNIVTAKVQYGTSLSNVDWLHGGAESLLTLTNLFIILGLRGALRRTNNTEQSTSSTRAQIEEEKSSL